MTGDWGRVNVTATYNRAEMFTSQTTSTTSGTEPGVNVSFASTRLGALPVYFAMNSDAARTVYHNRFGINADGTARDDPGLRHPTHGRLPDAARAADQVAVSERQRLRRLRAPRTSAKACRRSRSLRAAADPHLAALRGSARRGGRARSCSRVFSPQNAFADRVKHVIEPNFSIHRTTNVANQDRVPFTGSSYDFVIGKTTRMNYGLTNRLLVRKAPKEPEDGEPVPLATAGPTRAPERVDLSDLLHRRAREPGATRTCKAAGYRGASNFSPIVLNARSAPTDLSTATVLAEYDATLGLLNTLQRNRRRELPAGAGARRLEQPADLQRSQLYETVFSRTNNLDANATLNFARRPQRRHLLDELGHHARQIVQQRWIGFYNAQCCGLIARVSGVHLRRSGFRRPARPPLQPVVHARRHRHLFELLRQLGGTRY